MTKSLPLIVALLVAPPALARDILLGQPIACTLGQDCYIQHYRDNLAGAGTADYVCGTSTYEGHSGTDFALFGFRDLERNVAVLAAAPGTVRASRDGEPDGAHLAQQSIANKECGNGVLIDHGGGWQSQYCHLKKGSIAVKQGDRVAMGAKLGAVGLSGQTEFPHLHLTLRKDGVEVDPFRPDPSSNCSASPAQTLWLDAPPYQPAGLIAAGVSIEPIPYEQVKSGVTAPAALPSSAPQLLLWAYGWGARKGDTVQFDLSGPKGSLLSHQEVLSKDQALFYRYAGKKARAAWPIGGYRATLTYLRAGKILGKEVTEFKITD